MSAFRCWITVTNRQDEDGPILWGVFKSRERALKWVKMQQEKYPGLLDENEYFEIIEMEESQESGE